MVTVILTGGASRRMGRDKATLLWNGGSMCQQLIDKYAPISEAVSYSVNERGRFSFENAVEIVDRFPDQGPLNGIVSAFEEFSCDMVFLTGVDIPLGEAALVQRLLELIGESDACVIMHGAKGIEPLFAIYRRSCAAPAREMLREGRRSFKAMFERIRVRYVTERELSGFELDRILANINTMEDYEKNSR